MGMPCALNCLGQQQSALDFGPLTRHPAPLGSVSVIASPILPSSSQSTSAHKWPHCRMLIWPFTAGCTSVWAVVSAGPRNLGDVSRTRQGRERVVVGFGHQRCGPDWTWAFAGSAFHPVCGTEHVGLQHAAGPPEQRLVHAAQPRDQCGQPEASARTCAENASLLSRASAMATRRSWTSSLRPSHGGYLYSRLLGRRQPCPSRRLSEDVLGMRLRIPFRGQSQDRLCHGWPSGRKAPTRGVQPACGISIEVYPHSH